jgi:hypothetical protein
MSKCSICIGFKKDTIITTECGHTFHQSCLEDYIKSTMKTFYEVSIGTVICPNCRHENNICNLITYPTTRNFKKIICTNFDSVNNLMSMITVMEANHNNYELILELENQVFRWYVLNSFILRFKHPLVNIAKNFLLNFIYIRIFSRNKINFLNVETNSELESENRIIDEYNELLQDKFDYSTTLMNQIYHSLK